MQSIQTQLEEALTLHQRLSRRGRAEAVKDAIAAVGLDLPVLSRYPGELSGGMGQRVMIALALLNNPEGADSRRANFGPRRPPAQPDPRAAGGAVRAAADGHATDQPRSAAGGRALRSRAGDVPGRQVDEMPASALPSATHPYTRTLWTCRPNAHTYGQMLPTLDRTQDFTETAHGDR